MIRLRTSSSQPTSLMKLCVALATLLIAINCVAGQTVSCAPSTSTMKKWSQLYGGSTGVITIRTGTTVLLDRSTTNIAGLRIQSGAKLYFDWNRDTTLTTNYIIVNGEIHIGSQKCPMQKKVTINLDGSEDLTIDGTNAIGRRAFAIGRGGVAEIHGLKGSARPWANLDRTALKGSTRIQLNQDVATTSTSLNTASWKAGDKIVIGTTDYDPEQSEVMQIKQVINARTLELTAPLKFMHYGVLDRLHWIDERAEVGLLTRNILIQDGRATIDNYGAHFMVAAGAKSARISGAEFYRMGQQGMGRYPIHFHLAGALTGSYAKSNSVWKSKFRCIVLHATHNLLIEGNVAYDNYGHCYYLEDGVEKNNTFNRNLGILTRAKNTGDRLGSDRIGGVSTFWITAFDNTFTNNVAVGSENSGYWLHPRMGPRGPSYTNPLYKGVNPGRVPLRKFDGNKAVGCDHGFNLEATYFDSADIPRSPGAPMTSYDPVRDGKPADTNIVNFKAHHNRFRGLWSRTSSINLINNKYSNNYEGAELGTSGDHPAPGIQQVTGTVFEGWNNNLGNKVDTKWQQWNYQLGRSMPRRGSPMVGMAMYDGPQQLRDCTFKNYVTKSTDTPHSAIGTRFVGLFQIATTNSLTNCKFINVTRRVHVSDRAADGGKGFNFRDVSGSVSGSGGSTILTNWGYYKTPNCRTSSSYGLACPHKYAQLWVIDFRSTGSVNNDLVTLRVNHADSAHRNYEMSWDGFFSAGRWRYQPLVSIGATYLLRWKSFTPSKVALQINNAELGEKTNLAVCYPRGTTINSVRRGLANYPGSGVLPNPNSGTTTLAKAGSRRDASVSSGDRYYYDSGRGILFVTVKARNTRVFDSFCSAKGCDYVYVDTTIPAGAGPADCTNAAFSGDSIAITSGDWLADRL